MEFKKVNELQADIFIEGEKVGHIEKHGQGWWIEVFYARQNFDEWNKARCEGWIEMTHRLFIARVALSVKRLEKYSDWKIKG